MDVTDVYSALFLHYPKENGVTTFSIAYYFFPIIFMVQCYRAADTADYQLQLQSERRVECAKYATFIILLGAVEN